MVLLRQFLLLPLLSFLLLPGFYLNMLVLIFILVSRHCRFACSCFGFAYVLRGNEFTQSLLANFCYDSGLLHLFPCSFFYWSNFEPFSLQVLIDLNRCVGSLPLDLRTLLFFSLMPFSSASLGRRCWSSSMGSSSSSSLLASFTTLAQASLWAPLDVGSSGSLHGELHDSDDSVLQLICGFIQVCASVMCGGVHVCLAIWPGM